jgi:hypothetical protein
MKYGVEMASGGIMIYIPSFTEFGSGVQKLFWEEGTHTQKHRQQGDR